MSNKTFLVFHFVLSALLLAVSAGGWAQDESNLTSQLTQGNKKQVIYPFDANDKIQGYIGPMKSRYFLGEPIVVPLVLVNQSKYPITLETGVNPRAQVKILIRPEGQPQFRYNGPYMEGYYAPIPFKLFPLDEHTIKLIVWADSEIPGYLALNKPGRYTFDISIQVGVKESTVKGVLQPVGNVFTVTVDPAPKGMEPLLEWFKQDMNLLGLQLHKPLRSGPKVAEIMQQYPSSVFTPYFCYSLASYYATAYDEKPTSANADSALMFYQLTVQSDSPFKMEAYVDLLEFLDKLKLAIPAEAIARRCVAQAAPEMRGKIGNHPLLKKYLINSEELDPIKYWAFLP